MYWSRASTLGAYAAVLISFVVPIGYLIIHRIQGPVYLGDYKVRDQDVGFSTSVLAAVAMIVISLCSRGSTRYWDLGKTVREMNE